MRVAPNGQGRIPLGSVPLILMYHAVDRVDYDPSMLCVSPERFAAQMSWLRWRGLRGVAVGTLVAAMRAGRARGLVGITFDDGYVSVLEHAVPVLLRHEFTATVFVISEKAGGTNDWDDGTPWPLLARSQVGELAAAGLEIGSHSATHVRLAGADPGRLAAEVGGSRDSLRKVTDAEVRGFAYPYGSMDAAARRAVREAGYDYACAVEAPPLADLGMTALPRTYVGERDTSSRMAAKRLLYRGNVALQGRRTDPSQRGGTRP